MSRTASLFASLFDIGPPRVTRETSAHRAAGADPAKRDPLRYLPPPGLAGWSALPGRDRRLLEWMAVADYLTAEQASVLVYGSLRVAQRRLARLRQYRLIHGFWSANAQRPRGRYAYRLTSACRAELEALMWGDTPLPRFARGDARSVIHHLAVHDLLAAFLRSATPDAGLVAWLPERVAAALFGGYLRPDAIAAVTLPDRLLLLFVERDTGTERPATLGAKVRRYRAVLGARADVLPAHVVFVTGSGRRARSMLTGFARIGGRDEPRLWITTARELIVAPWDVRLRSPRGDGQMLGDFAAHRPAPDAIRLGPGCLVDPDQAAGLDEQALLLLPMLDHFRLKAGL